MKTIRNPLLWLTLGALLLCGLSVFNGCATNQTRPTPQAIVFYSFRSTWDGALQSYTAAQKLSLQGKIKSADMADIDQAWNKFRASFRIAFVAASRDWKSAAPQDVLKLRDDLLTLIASL